MKMQIEPYDTHQLDAVISLSLRAWTPVFNSIQNAMDTDVYRVTILGANAGIHLMVKIQTALPDNTIIQKAAAMGVGLISARRYYLQPQHQGEFIFGYAQLEEDQIEQGIKKLSQVLKS